jgi:serine/threonine-protein kinase
MMPKLGKYEFRRRLGGGSYGQVFEYLDTELNRPVAIKIPNDEDAENFEKIGAKIMSYLQHENIVCLIRAQRIENAYCIVMEYVDGENLRDLIKREAPLPVERSIGIISQVCRALEFAHTLKASVIVEGVRRDLNGIIHRDIKPSNILVTADNKVKVTDFGVSKIWLAAEPPSRTIVGSTPYMAPEQLQGQATFQSDIWSVSVVLYQMLTGELPFKAQTNDELKSKILAGELDFSPVALRYLPTEVQVVLMKALEKDLAKRYASITEFQSDLLRCLQGKPEVYCNKCGALIPHGRLDCPECTRKSKKISGDKTSGGGDSVVKKPGWYKYGLALVLLMLAAALFWLYYARIYQPEAAYRNVVVLLENSEKTYDEKISLLGSFLEKNKDSKHAGQLQQKLKQLEEEKKAFDAATQAERDPNVDYEDKINAWRTFISRLPRGRVAGLAQGKLQQWERERALFGDAVNLEKDGTVKYQEIVARWEKFLKEQSSDFKSAYAQERIKFWQARIDNYTGDVILKILQAFNLPTEPGLLGRPSEADGYVKVFLDKKMIYHTKVIRNTKSPEWNEIVRFNYQPDMELTIALYDKNLIFDTLIGRIATKQLPADGKHELEDKAGWKLVYEIVRER